MSKNGTAILMISDSESNPNLYYATRFIVPDPCVYLEIRGKKILLMSDLEVDRARAQASVDEVVSISALAKEIKAKTGKAPRMLDLLEYYLRRKRIKDLLVPGNFGVEYADPLRARGFTIRHKDEPFYEQRVIKTAEEIKKINQSQRHTEAAVDAAIVVLRASKIVGDELMHEGKALTSEALKKVINVALMERNMVGEHTILSCGKDCVDPHNQGSGLLRPHQSIIMDVFPRSGDTRYYADFTRTVVKGKASAKLKKMYAAVAQGQEIAFGMMKAGVDGAAVHKAIQEYFTAQGFPTGVIKGRMQGFFHGTGHGLGLQVHEPPRVSPGKHILRTGEVVTVEPGLYYADAGGVRLEDLVVIRKKGITNLTQYPKFLEIQ